MSHENFRWIIPNKLAASHTPTKKELEKYISIGINTIICLQTWEKSDIYGDFDKPRYCHKDVKDLKIDLFHIPVPDGLPPTDEQMDTFTRIVDNPKRIAVVHCHSGIGRTGCMLAVYMAHTYNLNSSEALRKLRDIWICYIQTPEQELAVRDYLNKKDKQKSKMTVCKECHHKMCKCGHCEGKHCTECNGCDVTDCKCLKFEEIFL